MLPGSHAFTLSIGGGAADDDTCKGKPREKWPSTWKIQTEMDDASR